MKKALLAVLISSFFFPSFAQFSQKARDSLRAISSKDHQLMMQQLGITELRPGPSGNPDAPNAANRDETKAKTYAELPDPLVFNNGENVNSPKDWQKRRKEIIEDFDLEVYGRVPDNVPDINWEVVSSKDTVEGDHKVTIRQLLGHVDNSAYPEISVSIGMTVASPTGVKEPVPLIIEFGFNFPRSWTRRRPQPEGPTWKQQLLAKGWGYAILTPTSFQADNGAGLTQGIIGLVNKAETRKPADWGTLRAWAWGASRAIDYFEQDQSIDENRIGIEGLSRYGKAAVVAMAYESRIAIGFIGSSGAGGAKILRRNLGEQVENLAGSGEYHWFAGNFIKYAGPLTVNDLPVDAHELVALCAPRPIFISAGSAAVEGSWIDAKGSFLAGVYAGPVYELLGKKDLGTSEYPPEQTNLADGDIAFRQHEGGHTTGPNWPYFIAFAERYFSK